MPNGKMTAYGEPPGLEQSYGTVSRQAGWALCKVTDGTPLLRPEACAGQLVLRDTDPAAAVRASFVLRARPTGAETFLFVEKASMERPVTRPGGPQPVQIRATVKQVRASQERQVVLLDALTVLAAARDKVEVLDVQWGG